MCLNSLKLKSLKLNSCLKIVIKSSPITQSFIHCIAIKVNQFNINYEKLKYIFLSKLIFSLVQTGETHPVDGFAGRGQNRPDQESFRNSKKRKSKFRFRIFHGRGSNRGRSSSGF